MGLQADAPWFVQLSMPNEGNDNRERQLKSLDESNEKTFMVQNSEAGELKV